MKIGTALKASVAAVLAAVVLFPGWARAEVVAGQQIVGLDIGAAVPFAKMDIPGMGKRSVADPGFLVGAQYVYHLTPNIGLGADLGYSPYGDKTIDLDAAHGPGSHVDVSSHKLSFEALARYVFMAQSKFNPYAIVGLGVNSVSLKASYTGQFGSSLVSGLTALDDSYTSLAFSAGGGFETEVMKSVIAGFEARWRYLGNHAFSGGVRPGSAAFGPASEVTMALRVGYKFGGK